MPTTNRKSSPGAPSGVFIMVMALASASCSSPTGTDGGKARNDAGAGDVGCRGEVCDLADSGRVDLAGPSTDVGPDADMTRVTDASVPLPPVDCSAVEGEGWQLCTQTADTCALVFDDSTGCSAACGRLGLTCVDSREDLAGACSPDESMPGLACADTGHISDYCVCGRSDDEPGPDAGSNADMGTVGSCTPDRPWECLVDDAVGFAAGVTGGKGGELCWVRNTDSIGAESLADCLGRPSPRWVVFEVSGTIRFSGNVPADTTIDGRGQDVTIEATGSHLFDTRDNDNIIIAYLKLRGAEFDNVHVGAGGDGIWLHHLTVEDAGDELMGIDGTNVTVSWSHLRNNNYAMLIGGAARNYDTWVTLHHNLFEGNSERHPRTRAHVHSFNNVIDYQLSGGRVSFDGELLSERNVYTTSTGGAALVSRAGGAVTNPGHYRSVEDSLRGDAFLDNDNDPVPVFDASTYYEYEVDAADDSLVSQVQSGAGWQSVPLPMP